MADCTGCDQSKVMHVAVVSVFAFVALVSVIFRLWARSIKSVRLELNDYLCIGGLIFAIASTVLSVYSYVDWGFFSISVAGDSQTVAIRYKTLLAGQLLWVTAVTFIRASVIFLYIHIFVKRPFRIACYVVLTVNMIYFTATMLACCLICRPFAYNWDQSLHGTCGDQKSLDLFIGVFNLLMDITTVALPLPVLWRLQMPTGRKIAISALMSMGTTICIITLVRIKVTTEITPSNVSAQYALIALLTCLEASLGVVNACLPVSKPVFDKFKPALLVNAVSRWSSSTRSNSRRSAKPKIVDLPMVEQKRRDMQRSSQESAMNLPAAVWSPPSSPSKGFE